VKISFRQSLAGLQRSYQFIPGLLYDEPAFDATPDHAPRSAL